MNVNSKSSLDSILHKVPEIEDLGFNYVLIIHDSKNKKAILRCSQTAQAFLDETSFIQEFLEYFKKCENFKNGIVKRQEDKLNDENIPINETKFSNTVNSPEKLIVKKLNIPKKPIIDCPRTKIIRDTLCLNNILIDGHKKPIIKISKIHTDCLTWPVVTNLVSPKKSHIKFNDVRDKKNKNEVKINKLIPNKSPFTEESKKIEINDCSLPSTKNNKSKETTTRDNLLSTYFDMASRERLFMLKNNLSDKNAKSLFRVVDSICEDTFENERFVTELSSILYKCLVCEKTFKAAHDAEMHCWVHEKIISNSYLKPSEINLITRTYQCDFCERFFTDQEFLKLHSWTHTNSIINTNVKVEMFECTICRKMYPTKDQLKRHNFNVHIDGYSTCKLCSKIFRSRKLMEHMRAVHLNNKVKCPKCSKVFKRAISLRWHLEDHAAKEAGINNTFVCTKCNKSFTSGVRLRIHSRLDCTKIKVQNSSILCPICGNNFSTNMTLDFHLRLKHADEGLSGVVPIKKIKCKICNQFIVKSRSSYHMRIHSNEKLFKCDTCSKSYKFYHSLKKHKKKRSCP